MEARYFTVGVITSTHGLRGEVKVYPRTDFPELRFRPGSLLYLRKPGQTPVRELTVRSARPHKNLWLVGFSGLPTIHDVESFRGMELCVHERQLPELPEGTYYIHQLVGLRVVTENGEELGTLSEVLTPGANDVYVVRAPGRKRDILLPAIADCIRTVDLDRGLMVVRLLPGLIDEDEEGEQPRGGYHAQ
ncbi:ribosome maturation factor RimM [Alicyclobacillus cellulosilyticus]|uniref:Ribosome maturation factor RimM n=1 Tax=Alicyclobacillus cellulosilyticus TaxID=1003997 RepID=A0A917KET8_9BACL|nr:ribosome maturation factor RimM [Alicyclobacillus cellulosilyticus]GGJ07924.1 ribosome maturation factor RimM [Alicyclobacillus cellulosilyticus]